MNTFFTADTHFSHAGILKFCNRPFSSTTEMNTTLFETWKRTIGKEDTVFHLGDVANGNVLSFIDKIKKLPGKKFLVPGNHDVKWLDALSQVFTILPPLYETILTVKKRQQRVVMCHYPLVTWNGAYRGAIMLHGHVHGRVSGNSFQTDIGVDAWDFRPVRLEEVLQRLSTLPAYDFPDAAPEEEYLL